MFANGYWNIFSSTVSVIPRISLSPDITLKMLMAAIRKGKLPRDFPIVGSFFKNNSPLILLEDSKREKENENIKCRHGIHIRVSTIT